MLKNNLLFAWRNILRQKVYSIINISGLAVSLAACWLIVLYIKDEWSFDDFNLKADRIVRVVQHEEWEGGNMHLAVTAPPLAPQLKQQFPGIESAVRIDAEGGGVISYGNTVLKINDIITADAALFNVFSFDFLEGNAETALTDPAAIVLTESLAQKLFGRRESVVNEMVMFPGAEPARVSAVIKDIPENSHLRFSAVRPLPVGFTGNWNNASVYTYLLVRTPEGVAALNRQLPDFVARTVKKEVHGARFELALQPLRSIHLQSDLDYEISRNGSLSRIYIFSGIALLILLIAIINYVNLSTARASARVKEIGVRKTLGSGRWQLAALFITEAGLVTIVAGLLAVVLVRFLMPVFNQLSGKNLNIWRFGVLPAVLFIILFSLAAGLISGIYPALVLSGFQTIPALKGNVEKMGGTVFFRKTLLVFQFVITVFMLSASFIIYQQLNYVSHAELGFNKEQVVSFHIDSRALRGQLSVIKAELLKSPLIESAAVAGNPIGNNDLGNYGYYWENEQRSMSAQTKAMQQLIVDADYLPTMQIRLKEGRNFSKEIITDESNAVLVNETLVKEMGWTSPLGKKMLSASDKDAQPKTVVGVIRDFHTYSFQHKMEPLVLILPPNVKEQDNLYVRLAKGKAVQAMAYLTATYKNFDPGNTPEFHFVDQNFEHQYDSEKKQGNLALLFTVLAMLLSLVGLFGLVSFTAQQMTREIGIRKVLGASLYNIIQLLSGNFVQLVIIAACIALPVSWYVMNQWLLQFAYHVPLQPLVFIGAGLIAALLAVVILVFRGLKAGLINPVKSLRAE